MRSRVFFQARRETPAAIPAAPSALPPIRPAAPSSFGRILAIGAYRSFVASILSGLPGYIELLLGRRGIQVPRVNFFVRKFVGFHTGLFADSPEVQIPFAFVPNTEPAGFQEFLALLGRLAALP